MDTETSTGTEVRGYKFEKYHKVRRLGTPETRGILDGVISVFEKIDGANFRVMLDENGNLQLGSRTRTLPPDDNQFAWAIQWMKDNLMQLKVQPGFIYYGEALVKHSVTYYPESYNKFYLFDIYDCASGRYLPYEEVEAFALAVDIPYIERWYEGPYQGEEHLMSFVGKSKYGDWGEGVVIKRYDGWTNQFGIQQWAKVVTDKFLEANREAFGAAEVKVSLTEEEKIANKYVTKARVVKAIELGVHNGKENTNDMRMTPWVMNIVWMDVLTEEILEIAEEVKVVDFKQLRRTISRRTAHVLEHEVLEFGA